MMHLRCQIEMTANPVTQRAERSRMLQGKLNGRFSQVVDLTRRREFKDFAERSLTIELPGRLALEEVADCLGTDSKQFGRPGLILVSQFHGPFNIAASGL